MIHYDAAWFCQGDLVRAFLQGLSLASLWMTRSGWESWDVWHDSEESRSTMMLWGYRNCVCTGGFRRHFCTHLHMSKKVGQVPGCHCWRKCVSVIVVSCVSNSAHCSQLDQCWVVHTLKILSERLSLDSSLNLLKQLEAMLMTVQNNLICI